MKKKIAKLIYKITNYCTPGCFYYNSKTKTTEKTKRGFYLRQKLANSMFEQCGKNITLEKFSVIGNHVTIGDNSGVGERCNIADYTTIGDNVMIGYGLLTYNVNHKFDRLDIPMIEQGMDEIKPIKIGNDVWIGSNVTLLPGAEISDGCVIGAECVIAKYIPPFSIVVGNPCKIVGNRIDRYNNSRD